MFDFERLDVYQKAKSVNSDVYRFLKTRKDIDKDVRDQLRRAAMSVMLNIAEGAGRLSKKDKRNFYITARASGFECVAVMDFLNGEGEMDKDMYTGFYQRYEELSKILFKMIQNLEGKASGNDASS